MISLVVFPSNFIRIAASLTSNGDEIHLTIKIHLRFLYFTRIQRGYFYICLNLWSQFKIVDSEFFYIVKSTLNTDLI